MPRAAAFEKNINLTPAIAAGIAVSLACFFILALRLWYLQILQGDYFLRLSENNRLRTVFLPPPRGLIYDRSGTVLAKNRPSFNVEFVPGDSDAPRETIGRLASLLDADPDELWARVSTSQRKRHRFEPKLVLKDVSRDVVAKVEAHRYQLPGVSISVTPTRDYLNGATASHVIGYIREVSSKQLENPEFSRYRLGDLVGQAGVELAHEDLLHGEHGRQEVIVNATGTRIGAAPAEPETPGRSVTLTLDLEVQKASDEALEGKAGAIVAMVPKTGEILALTSSPNFDPNVFTREIPPDIWQDLTGPLHRLNNRVTQGTYPPGSVFKVFMAVAGLAEGVISKDERVFCPGYYQLGRRTFHCHKKSGHGSVNLNEALMQSCDVYFYTVGQRLGVDRIHDWATRFGLGRLTEQDFAEERAGLIPSTAWKRRAFKRTEDQKWFPGETPSVSIGQGAVSITPLQITTGVAALVNGGFLMRPFVVSGIFDPEGKFHQEFGPTVRSKIDVDPHTLSYVRGLLAGVVNDARGTAHSAKLDKRFDILVGGKTGTAQVLQLAPDGRSGFAQDHAWFVGFAPVDKPEIVVTALVEHGGHGGVASAPLVKKVMEAYFDKKLGTKPPTADDVKKSSAATTEDLQD